MNKDVLIHVFYTDVTCMSCKSFNKKFVFQDYLGHKSLLVQQRLEKPKDIHSALTSCTF